MLLSDRGVSTECPLDVIRDGPGSWAECGFCGCAHLQAVCPGKTSGVCLRMGTDGVCFVLRETVGPCALGAGSSPNRSVPES